jgi:hypothetical protein
MPSPADRWRLKAEAKRRTRDSACPAAPRSRKRSRRYGGLTAIGRRGARSLYRFQQTQPRVSLPGGPKASTKLRPLPSGASMIRTIAFGTIIALGVASVAKASMRPVVMPADTNVTQVLVVCGPFSQWRKECQPRGPVHRHHHSHCFWSAGVQRCT